MNKTELLEKYNSIVGKYPDGELSKKQLINAIKGK